MMTNTSAQIRRERNLQLERVLSLLRNRIPKGELNAADWDALRVAVRVVYETEELGASLGHKTARARDRGISYWSDSMEGAIEHMSWVRELTSIATGVACSTSTAVNVSALWRRHRVLARRLLDARLTPTTRMSVLVELGGIEISLWGQMWMMDSLHPSPTTTRPGSAVRAARKREAHTAGSGQARRYRRAEPT